jgi:ribose transport system permease protein
MAVQRRVPAVRLGLDRFSGLYIWALFIVILGLKEPSLFLTGATAHTVASEQAVGGFLAVAVLFALVTGTYDLSVGAVANLSTIVVIWLQLTYHFNMWLAIVVAVLASAIIGAVNGFVVVKLKVNSFIATLGMGTILAAVQSIVSGNSQPIPPTSSAWLNLTQTNIGGFQIVFIYLIILGFGIWWLLDYTPAGRYMYAVGGNPDAARLSGVNVGRWVWLSLIGSATISGAAGVLYGSQSGPSLTYGPELLLPAFAAVFLGSTQIRPGRFNLWGTLLSIYVLATGVQGLQYMTGVQWLNDMFNGIALILAVAFALWRQNAAARADRRPLASDVMVGEDRAAPDSAPDVGASQNVP